MDTDAVTSAASSMADLAATLQNLGFAGGIIFALVVAWLVWREVRSRKAAPDPNPAGNGTTDVRCPGLAAVTEEIRDLADTTGRLAATVDRVAETTRELAEATRDVSDVIRSMHTEIEATRRDLAVIGERTNHMIART